MRWWNTEYHIILFIIFCVCESVGTHSTVFLEPNFKSWNKSGGQTNLNMSKQCPGVRICLFWAVQTNRVIVNLTTSYSWFVQKHSLIQKQSLYECIVESFTQLICSKAPIHSGTKQMTVFFNESLNHLLNQLIQKHWFFQKQNKWLVVSEIRYSPSRCI